MSVSFASRLEMDKNPVLFTQVATDLGRKFPDVKFHIMGEGKLEDEIKSIIKDYTNSNIIFHGFHPQPVTVFKESSVFISIQTTNNYPSQSVLEAMACGNVIISSDVGDTRMFVNENNGTLISLGYSALKDAIEYYIMNPEIAKSKGLYAAKYVKEQHTIEKISQYYDIIFREANREKMII
jgi:glycosyltransferase involved in cell wall biosynthesis